MDANYEVTNSGVEVELHYLFMNHTKSSHDRVINENEEITKGSVRSHFVI